MCVVRAADKRRTAAAAGRELATLFPPSAGNNSQLVFASSRQLGAGPQKPITARSHPSRAAGHRNAARWSGRRCLGPIHPLSETKRGHNKLAAWLGPKFNKEPERPASCLRMKHVILSGTSFMCPFGPSVSTGAPVDTRPGAERTY